MSNDRQRAGLNILATKLGRIIDPAGHAKDDRRRAESAALHRRCPYCDAPPHYSCVTRLTRENTSTHSARRN